MNTTYEAQTENHPKRLDPLEVGTRVRLHSGNDAGTIIGFVPARPRAVVQWDTGHREAWHVNDLVILAP